jgi:hypothetical protein
MLRIGFGVNHLTTPKVKMFGKFGGDSLVIRPIEHRAWSQKVA